MKGIVLCADDYGQETLISLAIIDLIKLSRLSAVSCLVTSPHWPADGLMLRDFTSSVDVGLHFNLTHGAGFDSLSNVMRKALLRQLKPANLEAEFERQLNSFTAVMGKMPDFIDGHQHVHEFPIVRDAILNCYQKHFSTHQAYIRSVYQPIRLQHYLDPKKMMIQLMGARQLKAKLNALRIPHNTSFSGVYSLRPSAHYARQFKAFLNEVTDGGIIMCHPGLGVSVVRDGMNSTRKKEYEFFKSDLFTQTLAAADCKLVRFKEWPSN